VWGERNLARRHERAALTGKQAVEEEHKKSDHVHIFFAEECEISWTLNIDMMYENMDSTTMQMQTMNLQNIQHSMMVSYLQASKVR
jgi:hypothetical protein